MHVVFTIKCTPFALNVNTLSSQKWPSLWTLGAQQEIHKVPTISMGEAKHKTDDICKTLPLRAIM